MSTEDYVRLLHPLGSWGRPSGLIKIGQTAHGRTWSVDEAPTYAAVCTDETSYVSLNRFHGPRAGARLAELNALYLDPDPHLLPPGKTTDPAFWSLAASLHAEVLSLPLPSIEIATGRGIAVIWLLEPLSAKAAPRWSAAQRALIGLFSHLGADRACSDTARVFRLPGSINGKNGQQVPVLGGTQERLPLDELADAIFVAAGQPTREQLRRRRARVKARADGEVGVPRGLTQAARFGQIAGDLDRIAAAWGGRVPEGMRNSWLHLRATCLTHLDCEDLEAEVYMHASRVTPGLPNDEVRAIVRTALRQAEPQSGSVGMAGRYHYSGATIAERLGVGDAMAKTLDLRQVITAEERRKRKAERQRDRRLAGGAIPWADWLNANDVSATRPWEAEGVSRATWYRRRRAGTVSNTGFDDHDGP